MTTVFHASESKIKLPYHTWTVAKYHPDGRRRLAGRIGVADAASGDCAAVGGTRSLIGALNSLIGSFGASAGLGSHDSTGKTRALARKRTCMTAAGYAKELC